MLDTVRRVETPEGVELTLPVAGPIPRAAAWLVDLAIRGGVWLMLVIVLAPFELLQTAVTLIALFVLTWIYPILFEVLRDGATPGKRALKLRVLHDNGTPVGWTASVIRNVLRAADFLPFGYTAGLVSMLVNPDFRRLGDLAAATVVVHAERASAHVDLQAVAPVRPPFPLTVDEQQAVLEFAERVPRLTPERAEELAAAAAPLFPGESGGVRPLMGIAAWLSGRR